MPLNSKAFFNRDLSWLRFNHRVLQEASDNANPLYERLRFMAIFSSNLDEFFKVRVSEIRQIKKLDKPLRKRLISKPNKLLKEIKKQVHLHQQAFGSIYKKQLLPELKAKGIVVVGHTDFNTSQKKEAKAVLATFTSEHEEFIIENGDVQNTQFRPDNESLYLAGMLRGSKIIIVKIPDGIPRFYPFNKVVKGTHHITFIDDILKYHLTQKYKTDFFALKISRDAELYIDDEYAGDLVAKINEALGNRDTGEVTRALVDGKIPNKLLLGLCGLLDIRKVDIVTGWRYHNFKDFFGFPNPGNTLQEFEKYTPGRQQSFSELPSRFDAVRAKDRLSYFPYESFEDVLGFIQEAAMDNAVTGIKITLYRVAKDSAVAKALLIALENGKKVYVFMECKARFDEENNIAWGRTLEEHGAKVQYSYPGIKVHSKILLVNRVENQENKAYCYIGTGNFNEKTAKIYTDFGLFTANTKLTIEIDQVFQVLEGGLKTPQLKHLLVSPFTSRTSFEGLIQKEITNALNGKKAYIILKLNSLQDEKMIHLLYKASNAGVYIRMIVRGICCLVPGIKGQSENIYITSIVHRFLEHGRVYVFGNNGKEKIFMGSADFMTRNLDHRIEVITPILDKEVYLKIRNAITVQLNDKVKSRIIDETQKNTYIGKVSKKVSQPYYTKGTSHE